MKILSIFIKNFRRLYECKIDFSQDITVFVGANNSGKTSAMDALGKFLAGRKFVLNDVTISKRTAINRIGEKWTTDEDCKIPESLTEWEVIIPTMDVWIEVLPTEIHYVANLIPTLKWQSGKLGLRLTFQPKDISKLFLDYRKEFFAARNTEKARKNSADSARTIKIYPNDLCSFLERNLSTYFSVKSYILDPSKYEQSLEQPTPFEMECSTDNPLKGIIRIDMIDAQRGFSDPDSNESSNGKKQLSTQMRSYYDKHLDPEKMPSPEDLDILEATETARIVFDKNLASKFKPAIEELETLGYPGVSDPKITITTKFSASETLKHDSAVQYSMSAVDSNLMLPEKYNGLGYQNLISIVFDLMRFRDDWMREGKLKQVEDESNRVIEPLHLVLVEEPEAHLHMQVQQVFIRKAHSILIKHKFLKAHPNFTTQLAISTHSSHIARETSFANLRYFKRLPESTECGVATSKVINLSEVFGKGDKTDKFITRYLQTTHCDLFFADAAIIVEGSAESMLLPHFIRNKYPELNQRYISILSINGRHSHRLKPLIEKLCLNTLVIADLDTANNNNRKASLPILKKGMISSNYAITNWVIKESCLDKLLEIPKEHKVLECKEPYKYYVRIAYQTPVKIECNEQCYDALSSTFEDCLIYTNYKFFKNMNNNDIHGLVKKINESINQSNSFEELQKNIYDMMRSGESTQKAKFALDIIYDIDPNDIAVPVYIEEGLEWLQCLLRPEG